MADTTERGDPELGRRIKQAIAHSGTSRRQVAINIGITPQAAQKWETLGYLSKDHIPAFCRVTGVSIEWLLTGQGEMSAGNPLKDKQNEEIADLIQEALPARQRAELLAILAERTSRDIGETK